MAAVLSKTRKTFITQKDIARRNSPHSVEYFTVVQRHSYGAPLQRSNNAFVQSVHERFVYDSFVAVALVQQHVRTYRRKRCVSQEYPCACVE